jgi:transcriptional regulator with XRE-family HTH domain
MPETFYKSSKLRLILFKYNISQDELAEIADVKPYQISNMINRPKQCNPTLRTCNRIIYALKTLGAKEASLNLLFGAIYGTSKTKKTTTRSK